MTTGILQSQKVKENTRNGRIGRRSHKSNSQEQVELFRLDASFQGLQHVGVSGVLNQTFWSLTTAQEMLVEKLPSR